MTTVHMTAAQAVAVWAEQAVRDYLRTVPDVASAVNNDTRNINLDRDTSAKSTTYVTLYRAGGSEVPSFPSDRALITFHCYGGSRSAAHTLASAVRTAMLNLHNTALNSDVVASAASVETLYWLPENDGTPRYVLTALVRVRKTATA